MLRLLRNDSLAFLTICLAGCAVSPIVDGDDSDADSGFESSEGPATGPGADAPGDADPEDNGGAPSQPSGAGVSPASPGGTQKPDGGARAVKDAGGSAQRDAGAKDPAARDAGAKDAGANDAGRLDSGTSTSPPPTPTPTRDAGQTPPKPSGGSCSAASDCTESCVPVGILNCCRDNGTCGCTWAPGAYCL